MSEPGLYETGHLANPAAVEAERQVDRDRARLHLTDLEWAMRDERGRRLIYWLVFERGMLESSSFEPKIKDGLCASIHMARNEGIREFAIALAQEIQKEYRDLWLVMLDERLRADMADADQRQRARSSADTQGDES